MATENTRTDSAALSEVRLDVGVGRVVTGAPRPDEPFRIALLGDFRGRGRSTAGAEVPPSPLRPVRIDRDDFDDVLSRFAPTLRLSLADGAPAVNLTIRDLDDFHPDRLFESLPLFRSLRETRARLADPSTFRETAERLWGPGDSPPPPAPSSAETAPAPPPAPAGSLLDRILDESPTARGSAAQTRPAPAGDDLAEYIRRIVAPHAVPGADPRQADALGQLDAVIGEQMRALLHDPEFQALEALWRSVFLLVRRVPTDTQLQLHLIDVTRAELAADLAPERDLQASALHRVLVAEPGGTVGGVPWALVIGNFTFGPGEDDLQLLARLGQLARRARAPWIAGADPALVGSPSLASAPDPDSWSSTVPAGWDTLRRAREAAHIGLALPRYLLRLPYGKDSDPCERFAFEELGGAPAHEAYLWGNPATACALLLAQSFAADGWGLRPGADRELTDLPLHLIRDGASVAAKPCAEMVMTERAAERILERGVMPLAWVKDRDSALLVHFQSIAAPPAPLAGRWTRAGTG